MVFTRKIDRAFQWAGEKMGAEARTTHSDEFKALEKDMTLRHEGMDRLQKSMATYVKWVSRRCDSGEDKDRSTPAQHLGRTMTSHGEELDPRSEFGNCLVHAGRANERVASFQDNYAEAASTLWLEHLEKNVAMMKEYTNARKKLESRRLAYDASSTKLQKARRDDFRIEEEVRLNKAKFEESSEDVFRRMQDIKDVESDSVVALTSLLDAQLEFHQKATEELRRVRQSWAAHQQHPFQESSRTNRSRSNTARSWQEPRQSTAYENDEETSPTATRVPGRPAQSQRGPPPPIPPPAMRPTVTRAVTAHVTRNTSETPCGVPRFPSNGLSRIRTDHPSFNHHHRGDGFTDDACDASSGSGSPEPGTRSVSPATSYGSMTHGQNNVTLPTKKAPPPPPPPPINRAKKPPPPPPARREHLGYS